MEVKMNLKRKRQPEPLNDRDMIVAENLYEMANTTIPLVDNNLSQLSENHWKGNTLQHVDDLVTLANESILIDDLVTLANVHARFNEKPHASKHTIEASCDEIRIHFQREEAMRYLIPERSFKYTALDGRKCFVASLKHSDKPMTKSKSHYILKVAPPAYVTMCSLVRDAAARLPDGKGTKADICTLLRDSQYVIDNISDEVMKKIVTGALNRLGLDADPCVKHNDGLWTYLHRDRE